MTTKKSSTYKTEGGVLKHRKVMQQELGRRLGTNEVVHHIDHNRKHNNPENLEVMTREEHSRLHRMEQLNKK